MESGETRRIFLQMLDRRKQKLQSEAFKLAKLIYAEKPDRFERRLATYWQVGRDHIETSKTMGSGQTKKDAKAHRSKSQNRNLVSAPL